MLLRNVDEAIEQKPAENVNQRQQSQRINDKYFIIFMLQKQWHWTCTFCMLECDS